MIYCQYLAIIIHITHQIKALKIAFRNVDTTSDLQVKETRIVNCINELQEMLKYIKIVNTVPIIVLIIFEILTILFKKIHIIFFKKKEKKVLASSRIRI